MLKMVFGGDGQAPRRVLALGAHSDDIEIGCGGTLLELVERHPACAFRWVVLSATGERAREARESADSFLHRAGHAQVTVQEFRDGFFPYQGGAIKEFFEGLKREDNPDVIFTHYKDDLHQDHRLVSELTWNTFRDHLILEYEIPKYDGGLGSPNLFVHLSAATSRRKVDALIEHFVSQHSKRWFTPDLFLALSRLRGMESNSPSGHAEGFYCRKVIF